MACRGSDDVVAVEAKKVFLPDRRSIDFQLCQDKWLKVRVDVRSDSADSRLKSPKYRKPEL